MGDPCAQPGLKPCTGPRARRRAVAGSLIRATPSTASGPNRSSCRSSTGRDRTTSEAVPLTGPTEPARYCSDQSPSRASELVGHAPWHRKPDLAIETCHCPSRAWREGVWGVGIGPGRSYVHTHGQARGYPLSAASRLSPFHRAHRAACGVEGGWRTPAPLTAAIRTNTDRGGCRPGERSMRAARPRTVCVPGGATAGGGGISHPSRQGLPSSTTPWGPHLLLLRSCVGWGDALPARQATSATAHACSVAPV